MQKSGKSTKRLDRLAPNLVTICRFIWEWTYAKKQLAPRYPRGNFVGLGGKKCKSLENLPNGWTDWHQIWYTSADSSGNGHRLKQLPPPPDTPGGILVFFKGSQNAKVWKIYQTVGPIGTKFGTHLQIHMGMDIG